MRLHPYELLIEKYRGRFPDLDDHFQSLLIGGPGGVEHQEHTRKLLWRRLQENWKRMPEELRQAWIALDKDMFSILHTHIMHEIMQSQRDLELVLPLLRGSYPTNPGVSVTFDDLLTYHHGDLDPKAHPDVLRLLIAQGFADLNEHERKSARARAMVTSLISQYAAGGQSYRHVVQLLLAEADKYGWLPLFVADEWATWPKIGIRPDPKIIGMLVSSGAVPTDADLRTALPAWSRGHPDRKQAKRLLALLSGDKYVPSQESLDAVLEQDPTLEEYGEVVRRMLTLNPWLRTRFDPVGLPFLRTRAAEDLGWVTDPRSLETALSDPRTFDGLSTDVGVRAREKMEAYVGRQWPGDGTFNRAGLRRAWVTAVAIAGHRRAALAAGGGGGGGGGAFAGGGAGVGGGGGAGGAGAFAGGGAGVGGGGGAGGAGAFAGGGAGVGGGGGAGGAGAFAGGGGGGGVGGVGRVGRGRYYSDSDLHADLPPDDSDSDSDSALDDKLPRIRRPARNYYGVE